MRYEPPVGANDPQAPYVARNVSAGVAGSLVPARAIEGPQREIVAAILAAGLVPSLNNLGQLAQAIQAISQIIGDAAGRDAAAVVVSTQAIMVDTKAQLDANTTALIGQVLTGVGIGLYSRATPSNPATAWVLRDANTVPGLGARMERRRQIAARAVATGNVAVSTGLAAGQAIDGLTLAAGDVVFLPRQTAGQENGLYLVPASGAGTRLAEAATYDSHVGLSVVAAQGASEAGKVYRITSAPGGVIGGTAITVERVIPPPAREHDPFPWIGIRPLLARRPKVTRSLEAAQKVSRASLATSVDDRGIIRTVPANVPRFPYDPTTLEPIGQLLEPAVTPLSLAPEDFSNAAWVKDGVTIATNTGASPDGEVNADGIYPTTDLAEHRIYQDVTITSAQTVTSSIFGKVGTYRYIRGVIGSGANSVTVDFDIGAGTVSPAVVAGVATLVNLPKIKLYSAFGYYRMSLSGKVNGGVTTARIVWQILGNPDKAAVFAGNGVSGIGAWGAIAEGTSYASSYLASAGVPIARARDVELADLPSASFAAHTIFVKAIVRPGFVGNQTAGEVYAEDDGTTGNSVVLRLLASTGQMCLSVTTGGVAQTGNIGSGGAIAEETIVVCAARLERDNIAFKVRGGSLAKDTAATLPSVSTIRLGMSVATTANSNVVIQEAYSLPFAASDADLDRMVEDGSPANVAAEFRNGRPVREVVGGHFLKNTRAKLTRLAMGRSTQLVVAVVGDSWTADPQRYVEQLATYLNRYGDAGVGFVGWGWPVSPGNPYGCGRYPEAPTAFSAGWTSLDDQQTPHRAAATTTTPGETITQTFPAGHDSGRLFYVKTSNGAARYSWNGGGWIAVDLTAGTGAASLALAGVPSAGGTLVVESVSGTVTLGGVDLRSPNPGVRFHKLGNNGQQTKLISEAAQGAWIAQMQALAPDAVLLFSGTNDQAGYSGVATEGYCNTIIDLLKGALPNIEGAVVSSPENSAGRTRLMAEIELGLYRSAVSRRWTHLDLQYAFGDGPAEYGFGTGLNWFSDALHIGFDGDGGGAINGAVLRMINAPPPST